MKRERATNGIEKKSVSYFSERENALKQAIPMEYRIMEPGLQANSLYPCFT